MLGTATGPKLLTNLVKTFRDDSVLLPKEPYYNGTAAALAETATVSVPSVSPPR